MTDISGGTGPTGPFPPLISVTGVTGPTGPFPPLISVTGVTGPTTSLLPVVINATGPTGPIPLFPLPTGPTGPTRNMYDYISYIIGKDLGDSVTKFDGFFQGMTIAYNITGSTLTIVVSKSS